MFLNVLYKHKKLAIM